MFEVGSSGLSPVCGSLHVAARSLHRRCTPRHSRCTAAAGRVSVAAVTASQSLHSASVRVTSRRVASIYLCPNGQCCELDITTQYESLYQCSDDFKQQ